MPVSKKDRDQSPERSVGSDNTTKRSKLSKRPQVFVVSRHGRAETIYTTLEEAVAHVEHRISEHHFPEQYRRSGEDTEYISWKRGFSDIMEVEAFYVFDKQNEWVSHVESKT